MMEVLENVRRKVGILFGRLIKGAVITTNDLFPNILTDQPENTKMV